MIHFKNVTIEISIVIDCEATANNVIEESEIAIINNKQEPQSK